MAAHFLGELSFPLWALHLPSVRALVSKELVQEEEDWLAPPQAHRVDWRPLRKRSHEPVACGLLREVAPDRRGLVTLRCANAEGGDFYLLREQWQARGISYSHQGFGAAGGADDFRLTVVFGPLAEEHGWGLYQAGQPTPAGLLDLLASEGGVEQVRRLLADWVANDTQARPETLVLHGEGAIGWPGLWRALASACASDDAADFAALFALLEARLPSLEAQRDAAIRLRLLAFAYCAHNLAAVQRLEAAGLRLLPAELEQVRAANDALRVGVAHQNPVATFVAAGAARDAVATTLAAVAAA